MNNFSVMRVRTENLIRVRELKNVYREQNPEFKNVPISDDKILFELLEIAGKFIKK